MMYMIRGMWRAQRGKVPELILALDVLLAFVLLFFQPMASSANTAVELVAYMSRLQYFAHKTGLAIQAKNEPLIHFYLHELEEVIEKVREVKVFDGYPIGQLAQQILQPAFEKLEKSVEDKQLMQAQADYDAMLHACNNCHKAAKRDFIKIEKRLDNPFIQSFAP